MTIKEMVKTRGLKWVFPRGNPKAPLWIIGEAPGADEEREGFAFVGSSGKEQNRMMEEAGLGDCYFTNPYKIRPPNNEMHRFEELGISKKLFEEDFLEELRTYKPSIIVTVGETPTKLLCPGTVPRRKTAGYIHNWMGSLIRSPFLAWDHYVIPNLHPAYILRNWGERVVAVLIYSKAKEELDWLRVNGSLQPLPIRRIKFKMTEDEIYEELASIQSGSKISFDIEMLRRRFPYTIAIATSPYKAFAFKLWGHNRGSNIFRRLDDVLTGCQLIGQNCTVFDCNWLNSIGFNCNINQVEDIMIRHHIRWPELRHRLAFTTMQYTREPYYKDDGRQWTMNDSIDTLLRYNGLDSCITYEVYLAQEKELR